jgi:hypothetical protein
MTKQTKTACFRLFSSVLAWLRLSFRFQGIRKKNGAEGRTRTGTQVTLRGILTPLRLFQPE